MLRGNRYTSATFKKTILQFPADKICAALNDNQDIIASLDFDMDMQSLLVEALVKIAAEKSFQKNVADVLLNFFDGKLKDANFPQLNCLITMLKEHKLEQETKNYLLMTFIDRCSRVITDTTDVCVLLIQLPREIHDDFIQILMTKYWEVPENERDTPGYVSKNINRFVEDSTLDVLRELSGLSFATMLVMTAFAAPAFAREESIISLLMITITGLCTKMDVWQRARILNNSDIYTRSQLQGSEGVAMMQQRLIKEYEDSLSRFLKDISSFLFKKVNFNGVLQIMTYIDRCNDPLFTPDAKRIALRLLANNACSAVTGADEMNLVLERLHEDDRYGYLQVQDTFWQKELVSRRKAFLSGNNNSEATSHSFFHNPGCGEFLKRKILFAAGYLAREPEHPQLDMMNRQRK